MIRRAEIGAGLAAGLPAVVLVAAVLLGRRRGLPASRGAVALAIGLGTVVGQFVVAWPAIAKLLPPGPVPGPEWSSTFWMIFGDAAQLPMLIPPVALLLGVLDGGWPSPAWARWENRALATLLVVWLCLGWVPEETWQGHDLRPLATKASAFGVLFTAWSHLEWLAARVEGSRLLLPLLAVAGATAGILFAIEQAALTFLAVPLIAALTMAWLVSWFAPGISLAKGGVPVVVLTLSALVITAYLNSAAGRLPRASALLLAASPLTIWVTRIGPARRLRAWQATLLGTLAILIPLLVAVVLVARAIPPETPYSP
ncbi:MAG TPA: hypothetical protein VG406_25595 [Isosphaeraceae bacterium]|nr:hypothetical protein [Isosphaeraceae bacterium]